MDRTYRIGEFAALTGVSVRTLHHYDRIGLLRPSGHSDSGYRLYSERDLLCLQQVLTLRYLGFALRQIRELLHRPDFDLFASMRIQRQALGDRISELERARTALDELIACRQSTGRWDWALVLEASAAMRDDRKQKGENMEKYYTPEQLQQFEELARQVSPEERAEIERRWTELLAEVRVNRDLDPASAQARDLADRWNQLTQDTVAGWRGNQELLGVIGENYRQGRFEGDARAPQAADFAFIARVEQARQELTRED